MNVVESKIYKINPVYKKEFSELIKLYAQFGGGVESERFIKARSFSNVYEFYIYAYFVGLRTNKALMILSEDDTSTFWEMENWKPKPVVDYLVASAIAHSGFDMFAVENMDDRNVSDEVKKIKNTIEIYANGGLQYISKKLEDDPDLIDDELIFVRLLSDVG